MRFPTMSKWSLQAGASQDFLEKTHRWKSQEDVWFHDEKHQGRPEDLKNLALVTEGTIVWTREKNKRWIPWEVDGVIRWSKICFLRPRTWWYPWEDLGCFKG